MIIWFRHFSAARKGLCITSSLIWRWLQFFPRSSILCWLNPNKVNQLLFMLNSRAPFSCPKHCWWRKYLIATKKIFIAAKIFPETIQVGRDVGCSVFGPRVPVAWADTISDLEQGPNYYNINDMIHWYMLLLICRPVINIVQKWLLHPPR